MAEDVSGDSPDQLGFLEASQPAPAMAVPYKVLARKYRPRDFADLIGQEAMVRTLSNAFASGRIPQAWMLTGVRGVGKTTTARILARGLNHQTSDGTGQPTVDLVRPGIHCQSIIEGRHLDVMEIDAASNNGVEYIRQLNDSVRYAPVSARYKVYIIDEVHMMSGPAFNAFLKTLEEPPPHAKFIFATTEIRKVPVTILSRCQRFDLRRVDAAVLVSHLQKICAAEGVTAELDALQAIARAAEGSVRDSMSLLDQAIAHAAGAIALDDVRTMLGLADRVRIIDLFEMLMKGDLPSALTELRAQYDAGADPAAILTELAEFGHLVTRLKILPEAAKDNALTQAERVRGVEFAGRLSIRVLSRTWQMLLKGIAEVKEAGRPLPAAEMALVRLAHAADLPTPDQALKQLQERNGDGQASGMSGSQGSALAPQPGSGSASRAPLSAAGFAGTASQQPGSRTLGPRPLMTSQGGQSGSTQREAMPQALQRPAPVQIASLEDILALAARNRDIKMQTAIQRDLRPVRIEPGRLEFSLEPTGDRGIANLLSRKMKDWTGQTWMVAIVQADGQATLREQKEARERERKDNAASHPAVMAVMSSFPGAKIVDVRNRAAEAEAAHPVDDPGLAASLESGDGFIDADDDPYSDLDF